MTLMIVRWRRVRTRLIRFLPFLSTLSMKEFVHRMRLHYFLKTTVRDSAEEIVPKETLLTDRLIGCVLSRSGEAIPEAYPTHFVTPKKGRQPQLIVHNGRGKTC